MNSTLKEYKATRTPSYEFCDVELKTLVHGFARVRVIEICRINRHIDKPDL